MDSEGKLRVNGDLYLAVSDEHRTWFVAGAADAVTAALPIVSSEYVARLRAVAEYANAFDDQALREMFDRFMGASADRKKEGAAYWLMAAWSWGSGFDGVIRRHTKRSRLLHPFVFTTRATGREWRPKLGTALVYYALPLACVFLIWANVATIARAAGLSDGEARAAAIFAAILGVVFLDYPLRAALRRLGASRAAFKKFFYEVRTPAEEQALAANSAGQIGPRPVTEKKIRLEADKYLFLSEALRTSYLVGCLDMFSLISYYMSMPKIDEGGGKLSAGDVRHRVDEYFAARQWTKVESAAACIIAALSASV